MFEIFKFIYVMIIFLSIHFVSMNVNGKPFFILFKFYSLLHTQIYYLILIKFFFSLSKLQQVMRVDHIMSV
jgi:hypothetical protein